MGHTRVHRVRGDGARSRARDDRDATHASHTLPVLIVHEDAGAGAAGDAIAVAPVLALAHARPFAGGAGAFACVVGVSVWACVGRVGATINVVVIIIVVFTLVIVIFAVVARGVKSVGAVH